MTYAMSLNNVGFAELTHDEMLCVDGGDGLGKLLKEVVKEVVKSAAVDAVKTAVTTAVTNVGKSYVDAVKDGAYDRFDAPISP